MLPLMSYTYIIPFGKKVSNVIVTNIEEALYAGTYSIYPAQTGFYDAEFTGPDATIYNTNSFYPTSAIQFGKTGNLNGAKLTSISICPIKYNPVTGVVKIITKIDFTLVYSDDLITDYVKPGFTNQQSYNSLINQVVSLVQNKTEVNSLINIPMPTSTTKSLPSSLLSGNINANVDFVIITNDALKLGFQPIIEWKLKNGISATIVTTEWIYQNYTGCDQPEQIRMFIKDICQNWNTQYVLLGGSKDIIPLRYAWINAGPGNTLYGQFTVTDLYYSCLDGNWNADGDVTFGEARYNRIEGASPVHVGISADIDGVDVWPDIKVSRIPVNNVTELTNYRNKYFEYVQPSQSNVLNKNNVLLFSGPTDYSDTDLLWSGPYANDNLRQSFPSITPAELFYNPSSGNPPGTKPLVLDAINGNYNNTKFHIICGYGHGLEDKFQACGYSNINSSFITKSEIDGLTNTDRGQILFLNHCLTMAWDRDGIANHYITANNGGVAILGYNRQGIIYSPRDQNKPFFENIYGIDNHIGVAFNNVKLLNNSDVWNPPTTDNNARWNFFTFNMNADPNMEVWTDNPASFTSVNVTPSTINTQNANVTITVTNVPADLTVTFTLYKNGEVFATKTIISDALPKTWTFSDILVKTAGSLTYTVSAHDYVPYEGTIPINFNGVSHLYVFSNAITDNNNNNSKAEAGETVTMGVTLKNVGTLTDTKTLTLDWEKLDAANDNAIIINTGTLTYTNIAANGTQLQNYIITVNAASTYLTDGRNIHFYLKDGSTILTDFYLQVYKPEYTAIIKNITISGSDDNLTTGETATMIVELLNTSLADAKNVTAVLSENGTSYTTITQSTGSFGDIAQGGAAQNSNAFSFTVNSIPPGGKYFFDLVISSDYNPQCTTIIVNVPSPVHPQPIECSTLKFTNYSTESVPLNNDEILVYWEPVSDAIGYNIYRCNSNENGDNIGSYVKLNTTLLTNAFFKDVSSILTTQSYYNYKITKINQYAIESAYSCELHTWTSMIVANWPVETNVIATSPLNVADVYNDGQCEIFAVTNDSKITGYKPDGSKLFPGVSTGFFEINNPATTLDTWPAIGLVNVDEKMDLVVGSSESLWGSFNKVFAKNSLDVNPNNGIPDEVWTFPSTIMGAVKTSPVIVDINGDGSNETVFIVGKASEFASYQIYVLNNSGTSMSGWPKDLSTQTDEATGLAVGYFGNGIKIIVGAKSGIYVYNPDGTIYGSFTIGGYNYNSQPVIADIDGNGTNEILIVAAVSSSAGKIYAINSSMNAISTWNGVAVTLQSNTSFPSVSVGDLTGDNNLEVFFYSGNKLYVWNKVGVELFNKTFTNTGYRNFSAPIIADIDNDHSDAEIIFSIGYELKAYKINGQEIFGWNLKFGANVSCPTLADVDNDGKNELLFNANGKMYQYKTPGTPEKNEWPSFRNNPQNTGVYDNACYFVNTNYNVTNSQTWYNIRNNHQNIVVSNNSTLTIKNKLIMADNSTITVGSGCSLIVDNNAKITGCSNDYWNGEIIVQSGGTLTLNNGSQIRVSGLGKITIQATATINYNQNSVVYLKDNTTNLNITGNLVLGANANFTFTGGGYVKFSSTDATPSNLYAGTNAKIELSGSGQSDVVLEIAQERLALPRELYHLKIENAQVKMTHSSTRIFQNYELGQTAARCSLSNVKFTNNISGRSNYCGLSLYQTSGTYITGCYFEKGACGIFANLTQSSSTITITGCTFNNCYTGVQVYGKGATLTSCAIDFCYNGFYGTALINPTIINNCSMTGNTNYPIYYVGSSGADLTIESCAINSNSKGVLMDGGFTGNVHCSQITNNGISGLLVKNGCYLNMSQINSAGNNDLSLNKYPVYFQNANVPNLSQGYNKLIKKVVAGSFDLYGTLSCAFQTIYPSNNEWKSPNGNPVQGTDYNVWTSYTPTQYFNFIDLSPMAYSSCGGGGQQLSMPVSEMLMSDVSTINSSSFNNVSLPNAVSVAVTDMKAGNYVEALNKLFEIFSAVIKKPKANDHIVFNKAYSYLNTTLYKAINNGLLNNIQGLNALTKMLAINEKEIEKSSENYHRLLHRTLDKAHTYRLFGRQDLALGIIENILTWVNPEEYDYIKGWYCVNKAEIDYKTGLITLEEMDSLSQNCPCTIGSNMRHINSSGNEENHENGKMNIVSRNESVIEVVPNPVTSTSIITTIVNEKATNAELHVVSSQGVTVKTYKVTTSVTSIEIRNTDLSSGVYWLQLFVNGIPEKTKKIITIK